MNPLLYFEILLWFLLLCFTSEHPAAGTRQLGSLACTPLPRLWLWSGRFTCMPRG